MRGAEIHAVNDVCIVHSSAFGKVVITSSEWRYWVEMRAWMVLSF